MDVAVLIPVKRFDHAKGRLGTLLSTAERVRLARWLAEQVVAAARPLPVFIACDDDDAIAQAMAAARAVLPRLQVADAGPAHATTAARRRTAA